MAVTAIGDVFVPQVIGDTATDILFKLSPLLQSGVVRPVKPRSVDNAGNTVTFPYFNTTRTGLVQTNPGATRSGVTPSKISMSSYTEPLNSKIISLDSDKYAFDDSSEDLNQHIGELVANESALTLQDALCLSAQGTNLVHSILGESTKTLNVDSILTAKMKRGEKAQLGGAPILFAHSTCCKDLGLTSDLKTLASAATTSIVQAGTAVPPGAVAFVNGCWVVPMDSVRNQADIPAISSITRSSAVATVTTADVHNLVVGDEVIISGASPSEYNGTFTVATVPTTSTFTFAVSGTPASPATGSPVFTPVYTNILAWPGSLGLHIKKGVQATVKDVHAGTTVFTVDFDFRFASTLWRSNPRGVVLLRSK